MNFPLSVSLDEFQRQLFELLESEPGPISEYDLIQKLRDRSLFDMDSKELLSADSLVMYRIHFTVYHVLYRMRDELHDHQEFSLELSPIGIQLQAYQQGDVGLTQHDPLHDYYMDLDHLRDTQGKDVDEMLNRFWLRLDNSERRTEALRELQLEDPVDDEDIRKQYRRLAMRHHPDRGGDKETLQRINDAVSVLLNSYRL